MPAADSATSSALDFFPREMDLGPLRAAASGCRGCDLWERATQTVFGEGAAAAKLFLVGEQPGDVEDETGRPFVGPAGTLLDGCLKAAGIDRNAAYLTNTVKHFKWESRGQRRIHSKPNAREIRACKPWVEAEISIVRPVAVVCLGATAAQALLGREFRVLAHRGEFVESRLAPLVMATVHPSSILRAPDEATRHNAIERLTIELRRLNEAVQRLGGQA